MYTNNNYTYLNNLFLINLNRKYNKEIKERLMLFVDFKLKEINLSGLEFLEDALNIINIKTKEINDDFLLKNKEEIISFLNPEWFKENKVEKLNKENVFDFLCFHQRKGNIKVLNLIVDSFFRSFSSTSLNKNLDVSKFYFENKKHYLKKIGEKNVLKLISLNNLEKEFLKELFSVSLDFYIETKTKLNAFIVRKSIFKEDSKISFFLDFLKENNFKYELIEDQNFPGLYYDIKIEDNKYFIHEKFPFKFIKIVEFKTSLKEAEEEFNFLIS